MASISINGNVISGNNIRMTNGQIFVDGRNGTVDAKEINIAVIGNVDSITVDACNKIGVKGNVGEITTQSGDVDCGDVSGPVQTISGDVNCGHVGGSIKTMSGDINHRQ